MEMIWEEQRWTEKALLAAMDKALEGAAALATMHLKRATRSWKHEPKFRRWGPRWRGYDREIIVGPAPGDANTKIFVWVNNGTGPRRSKTGKPMRFKGGYVTKSRPFSLYGGPGRPPTRWVSKHEVKGIEARQFTDLTAERVQPWLNRRIFELTGNVFLGR